MPRRRGIGRTTVSTSGVIETSASDDVLRWGLPRLRDLPWRQTRDPWAILVSEVMLQQTQAVRVIPKWQQFLEAFPTPLDCADASLGDVLRLWQGLGYPRRARNLHAAAIEIAALGEFPSSLEGLLALPGVGRYTARAVLAFAFQTDAAVVETNIGRVSRAWPAGASLQCRPKPRPIPRCRPGSRGRGTSASWISAPCCAGQHRRVATAARWQADVRGAAQVMIRLWGQPASARSRPDSTAATGRLAASC